MKYDELAFFNQQLAVALRDGIPLEGALKELSAGMRQGPFRTEMEQLQADLVSGIPLKEALPRRRLPEFYIRMVELGARSNDLPGILTLIADYYHQANTLWSRLKGLLVYPIIVIVVALGLTVLLSIIFDRFLTEFYGALAQRSEFHLLALWVAPAVLAAIAFAICVAVSLPGIRARLRWKLPAFREASLAQLASAIALMLKNGTPLPEALTLAAAMESRSPAGRALREWRSIVEQGQGKPEQWGSIHPFPPLFLWLVQKGGEDVASGFQKAAEIYRARAAHRTEMLLYGALPVSVLFLAQMVFWQVAPMMQAMSSLMNHLGSFGE